VEIPSALFGKTGLLNVRVQYPYMGISQTSVTEELIMDKTGVIALIIGLILCALGGFAIWTFLPQVIVAVKGLIGIVVLLVGLMMVIFGILIFKD
jgi:hypothetical protein